MKIRNRVSIAGSAVALALAVGLAAAPAATAASVTASPAHPTRAIMLPSRDLGPCWAQAGRLVGGFFGSIAATVANPFGGAAAWATYLGGVANEPRTSDGDFAC